MRQTNRARTRGTRVVGGRPLFSVAPDLAGHLAATDTRGGAIQGLLHNHVAGVVGRAFLASIQPRLHGVQL